MKKMSDKVTIDLLKKEISSIKIRIVALESQRQIHQESNLFIVLRESGGRRRRTMNRLLLDERAFKVAVELLSNGSTYKTVVEELDESMGFKISDSSVGRFWDLYRQTVMGRRSER